MVNYPVLFITRQRKPKIETFWVYLAAYFGSIDFWTKCASDFTNLAIYEY